MRNQVWKTALSAGLIALASAGTVIGVGPFERFRSVSAQEMSQDAEQTIMGQLSAESKTMEDGSYFNVHVFDAEAGQTFLIEMVSNEFDAYLMVFDAEGNELAENDDGENDTNAQLYVTLPETGHYGVFANSSEAGEIGQYSLLIRAISTVNVNTLPNRSALYAEAESFFQQGNEHFEHHQFNEALASWKTALEIYQTIGSIQSEIDALNNLSAMYLFLQQYQEAVIYYQQSLEIYNMLENEQGQARILARLCDAYYSLHQHQKAVSYCEQSLEIYQVSESRQEEAAILASLGDIYIDLGQYQSAISYYENSFESLQAIQDIIGSARALNGLGIIYRSLGRYGEAVFYYEQSLEIVRTAQYIPGEAAVLGNLCNIYIGLEQYREAVTCHSEVLELFRMIDDGRGEALTLANLGIAYDLLGQYQESIAYSKKALEIYQDFEDIEGEANIYNNLAIVYRALGQYQEAISHYETAFEIYQLTNNIEREAHVLNNLGYLYLKIERYAEAEQLLLVSVSTLESLRDPELSDTSKVHFFETQRAGYITLQQALIAQNKTNSALEIAERSRARALVELIATQVSERAAEEVAITIPSAAEIQQIAQQQNATLVSYSIINFEDKNDFSLYIWVISPNGEISFKEIDLTNLDRPLSELVTVSRSTIGARSRNNNATIVASLSPEAKQQQQQSLKQLYDILIAPIASKLPTDESDRVIFIPQGELFLVPFAALIDENEQYLIENHTISISPSIQALALTHQLSNPNASLTANPLIVGNPTMPKLWNPDTNTEVDLISLPGAENEAMAIAQQLKTDALLHDNASETIVAERMQTASLIHLATHGLLDYGTPEETGVRDVPGAIALAPDSTNDGLLTSAEIFAMQLQAELVVLSACDTGRGTITSDGVIGLSRSLMQAGVPSVVVSLWSVPDDSTEFLMKEFYANLEEMDKVQALRQAMLTTMENSEYAEPLDWAAFTLVGEPE